MSSKLRPTQVTVTKRSFHARISNGGAVGDPSVAIWRTASTTVPAKLWSIAGVAVARMQGKRIEITIRCMTPLHEVIPLKSNYAGVPTDWVIVSGGGHLD